MAAEHEEWHIQNPLLPDVPSVAETPAPSLEIQVGEIPVIENDKVFETASAPAPLLDLPSTTTTTPIVPNHNNLLEINFLQSSPQWLVLNNARVRGIPSLLSFTAISVYSL